jgi:hypothetical protein
MATGTKESTQNELKHIFDAGDFWPDSLLGTDEKLSIKPS